MDAALEDVAYHSDSEENCKIGIGKTQKTLLYGMAQSTKGEAERAVCYVHLCEQCIWTDFSRTCRVTCGIRSRRIVASVNLRYMIKNHLLALCSGQMTMTVKLTCQSIFTCVFALCSDVPYETTAHGSFH